MPVETLRPAQEEILAYEGGTLAISAVPGAGKTFILTRLAARLVGELGVRPHEILILTYMRGAAATFKRRIASALAARGLTAYGLQAMTIHAFCLGVVRRHHADLRDPDVGESGLLVITEVEQVRILLDGLATYLADPAAKADWLLRYGAKGERGDDPRHDPRQATYESARRVISAAKQRGLGADEVWEALGTTQPELAFLFQHYQRALVVMHAVDFDDQVLQAIALLRAHPALLDWYQRRFRFVMEDEAQDSTPAQDSLIRLLTERPDGTPGNLIRVGDSNQSITASFTFNDPRFFRAFCHDPAVSHVRMDQSSRSAREILAIANALIEIAGRHADPVIGQAFDPIRIRPADAGKRNPTANGQPTWTVYASKENEQMGVLGQARAFLRANPGATAAVLLFSNAQVRAYREVAVRLEISLQAVERRAGGTQAVLALLEAVLAFLELPANGQQAGFQRVLRACMDARGERFTNGAAVSRYLANGVELAALVYPAHQLPPCRPPDLAEEDYASIIDVSRGLRLLLAARHLPATELLPTIAEVLLADPPTAMIAAKAAAIARHYIRLAPAPDPGQRPPDPLEIIRLEVAKLREASGQRELVLRASDLIGPEPGQLQVLTMHGAKGAEFDAVWLPALGYFYGQKGFFPWDLDQVEIQDQQAFLGQQRIIHYGQGPLPAYAEVVLDARRVLVAERLRLLYVGITRAERALHLSCAGGQREQPAPPHVLALAALCERLQP